MWGPPTTTATAAGIRTAFAEATALFSIGDGFGPQPVLSPTDVVLPGGPGIHRVMEGDRVLVEATRVFHGPELAHAYAYRFTVKRTGTVAVFSGDTAAPDANLIELARDCDVLVHEVQDNDNVQRIADSFPEPRAGRGAQAAPTGGPLGRPRRSAGGARRRRRPARLLPTTRHCPSQRRRISARPRPSRTRSATRVRSSRRPSWTSSSSEHGRGARGESIPAVGLRGRL